MDEHAVLSLKNITCRCGEKTILDDVSFDIHEGEFVSLIGPNGAGKSTLFHCLLNIMSQWQGEICLHGKALADFSQQAIARIVAYVPQQVEALPGFSVEEFVLLGRYPHRTGLGYESVDHQKVAEALAIVDLLDRSEQAVNTLSGGERQRACIAAAIVQEPRILLLDEPVSALDPHHQAEVLRLLARLHAAEGMTIFCISHDMNHAIQLSTRIFALKDGKLLFDDTPDALLKSSFIHDLFGIPFTMVPHEGYARPLVFPEGVYP